MIGPQPRVRSPALLADDSDVDLEQDVRPREARGDDSGRDRADAAEMLADHRIDRRPVSPVADIDCDLADILHRRAGLAKQRCEIGQRQIGLRARIRHRAAGRLDARMVKPGPGLAAHEEFLVGGKHHRTLPRESLAVPTLESIGPRVAGRTGRNCSFRVDLDDQFRQSEACDDQSGESGFA